MTEQYISQRRPFVFSHGVKVVSSASSGGTKEKNGPVGHLLDIHCPDESLSGDSWEKAESQMVKDTFSCALQKAQITEKSIDILFGGDLMNQCTGTSYGLCGFDVPYIGLYGACSTFIQGVMCASAMIESGLVKTAAVCVSSHFATAERQYRFPLEYGAFPGPSAQNTVTGCGCVILKRADPDEKGIFVKAALPGIVIDRGIKDAANMGAAMATAAADTTLRYLEASGKKVTDFDIIATGDLGAVGHDMELDMLKHHGVRDERGIFKDCGTLIYDVSSQDVGVGGSGCGCSAVVTSSLFFDLMNKGKIRNAAVIGTGAMMSPQSLLQGLSIPSVAHLAEFEVH